MKVHIAEDVARGLQEEYIDSNVAHTGQFFFEDDFLDQVYQLAPYRLTHGRQ